MAEYQEVVKQFKRMCEHNCSNCRLCPIESYRGIYHCWRWISEKPEKAEELIMKWAEEHPPITNRGKFKKVFGFDPVEHHLHVYEWLESKYKEPKDD